ncbi:hypothetical protein RN96_00420 [Fusobacterium polymorphum]|uniref:Uncharacterized protein n=1 Tax=Fusobacterium nucleatum subsp. polymorphum TaxID=76857 RepID=A0A2B7YKK5_FUSNP|nr:hypothetical protein RN96_00420 [Fusobacterium polymorphum]
MLNFINWFLIYVYSIMQLILFWDAIGTKIDTLNVIISTKKRVMNMMRFLELIFIMFTISNTFQGADSMFLYIQYR